MVVKKAPEQEDSARTSNRRSVMTMRILCLAASLAWFFACSEPALAIVLSDPLDDPVVMPGQLTYGLNLDGVALLGSPVPGATTTEDVISLCTGTLISSRHILTAAHCFDEDKNGKHDGIFSFFPFAATFELADRTAFVEIDTANVHFAPGWLTENADLAILQLKQDAPADIPRYPLYGDRDELGQEAILVGYGAFGTGLFGYDPPNVYGGHKRAGRNRYETVRSGFHIGYDFDSSLDENNALVQLGTSSELGLGDDEAMTAPGDSGGPAFIHGAIAGAHSYGHRVATADVNSANDSSWGELGFSTRVSNLRRFILDATDGQAVFTGLPNPCGDLDLDHDVDSADLLGFLEGWTGSLNPATGSATFTMGDCDVDRDIDSADLLTFLEHWSGSQANHMESVPEPCCPYLAGSGLAGLLLRRRARTRTA